MILHVTKSNKLAAVVLANERSDDHLLWLKACSEYENEIKCRVVNLTSHDWFEQIHSESFDILLAKPGGINEQLKKLYDERVTILARTMSYPIFPSLDEILIYENKRYLASWLKAKNLPHPVSQIFYDKNEALQFCEDRKFPIVAKTNIGASGSGVRILKNYSSAVQYINDTFSDKGAPQRTGPNLEKGDYLSRLWFMIQNPDKLKQKLKIYKSRSEGKQKGFVFFQEFIAHTFEWRIVRIGESFFAHKKLLKGEKASGSLLKGYDNPPLELFDFAKKITDENQFYSQALDVFESPNGYLINEMQCIFGQSDPYQMLVDGKPGRYIWKNNTWVFEEGYYNQNESYNLRVEHIIKTYR